MLVSDLKENLDTFNERTLETTFSELSVDEDAATLQVDGDQSEEFPFDEQLERTLSKYLGVSKSYLAKCPPDLKAYNINYWLQQKPQVPAVIEAIGDRLISIHKPGLVVLPLRQVGDVIVDAMEPTDEVVQLLRDDSRFHVDITTPHHIEVPTDDRISDRQQGERSVGDITHGGVRILSNPSGVAYSVTNHPVVTTYLHRLWCTNGCTSPEAEGTIRLRGNTIDEVMQEMSDAMSRVRGELDEKLAEYADIAQRRPPGSPVRFARQIGNEYGIRPTILNRILDRVELLPEDASLYDIQQVFTETANGNVPYRMMMRLQGLAGDMAMATEQVVHRCTTCERLLPE